MKPILFIVNTPPPYQGTTIMNQFLLQSFEEEKIDFIHLRVESSRELNDLGKFNAGKLKAALSILADIYKKRKEYDIAYLVMSVEGFAFYRHAGFVLLLQLLGKKSVLHLRGLGFRNKTGIGALITKRIFKKSWLIQHSVYNKFDIQRYNSKKVYYVPNGWNDYYPAYQKQIEEYRQRPGSTVNIVFLSNLIADKGLFTAIEAARAIQADAGNNGLTIKWSFIGKWENESSKQKFFHYIDEHNLQSILNHVGPLYNEEKYALLSTMDIMVFPTYYKHETWGNVILEGMMFKIPVIASNYVAIPEMIKDNVNGFLVTPKDVSMLAEKITILAQSPALRKEMGEKGRNIFLEHFTQEKFKHNMISVINEIR